MKKITLLLILSITLILSACNHNNPTGEYEAEGEIITEYFLRGDLWIFGDIGELNFRTTDVVRAEVIST